MLSVQPALFKYLEVCYLFPKQAWLQCCHVKCQPREFGLQDQKQAQLSAPHCRPAPLPNLMSQPCLSPSRLLS